MTLFDAADNCTPAVDRSRTMVAHHKEAIFRHLIREAEVTFSQGQLIDIRFRQHLAIHRDEAVAVNRNHIPGDTDDSLEQQLVLPVEAAQAAADQYLESVKAQYPAQDTEFSPAANNKGAYWK